MFQDLKILGIIQNVVFYICYIGLIIVVVYPMVFKCMDICFIIGNSLRFFSSKFSIQLDRMIKLQLDDRINIFVLAHLIH